MENDVNLKDLNMEELRGFLLGINEQPYRAAQLAKWVFRKGAATFDEMTDLSLELRTGLRSIAHLGLLDILQKQVSREGETIKYLLGLRDGQAVESVLMKYSYGRSACISTQVGCRMGCRFCASALGGFIRNLSPGEMYEQVMCLQRDTGEKISHVVLMGTGEPLDNLENVLKFLEIVNAPYAINIGYRNITLSTSGLVPGINDLAARRLPLTLAVSLHAPTDELRSSLMPVNRSYPLKQLMSSCRDYVNSTGRRITFEYALLKGVNDGPQQAGQLIRLLTGINCHINLIPANPVRERGFERTPPAGIRQFKSILEGAGLAVTIRRELGSDIDAACGQLRHRALRQARRNKLS